MWLATLSPRDIDLSAGGFESGDELPEGVFVDDRAYLSRLGQAQELGFQVGRLLGMGNTQVGQAGFGLGGEDLAQDLFPDGLGLGLLLALGLLLSLHHLLALGLGLYLRQAFLAKGIQIVVIHLVTHG